MKATLLFAFLAGLTLSACSGGSSKGSKGFFRALTEDGLSADTEIQQGKAVRLDLVAEHGSKLRLMNGRALTRVYERVFKPDAKGFAHCADDQPIQYDGCSLLFNAEERPSMGMFDLYSERMKRGLQNVSAPDSLTLNYMRNLRAALGRECVRLVANELAAPSNPQNLIVAEPSPTALGMENFVRKILDVPQKSVAIDIPFKEYEQAFQQAASQGEDLSKARRNAFVNLCISLAMDPQIFMY